MTQPFQPLPCGDGNAADVDTDFELLCDRQADGSQVLVAVEAVYDDAGVRTGTRTVDPVTGAPYTPTGTLGRCCEIDTEVLVLCDRFGASETTVLYDNTQPGGQGWTITSGPAGTTTPRAACGTQLTGDTLYRLAYDCTTTPGEAPGPVGVYVYSKTLFSPQAGTGTLSIGTIQADDVLVDVRVNGVSYGNAAATVDIALVEGANLVEVLVNNTRPANTSWGGSLTATTPGGVLTFQRRITYNSCTGQRLSVTDTYLDGVTPYTPLHATIDCGQHTDQVDVELLPVCVFDTGRGGVLVQDGLVQERVYDAETGDLQSTRLTFPDGTPYTLPGGGTFTIGECPDVEVDVEVLELCDLLPLPTLSAAQPGLAFTTSFAPGDTGGRPGTTPGWGGFEGFGDVIYNGSTDLRFGSVTQNEGPANHITRPVTVVPGVHYDLTSWVDNGNVDGARTSALRLVVRDGWPQGPVLIDTVLGADDPTPIAANVGALESPQVHTADFVPSGTEVYVSYYDASADGSNEFPILNDVRVRARPDQYADAVPFLRRYTFDRDTGNQLSSADFRLDGVTPYIPQGEVGSCDVKAPVPVEGVHRDVEPVLLCDVVLAGPGQTQATPTQFLRHFVYEEKSGALVASRDTALDGLAPYTPVGTVSRCCDSVVSMTCVRETFDAEEIGTRAGNGWQTYSGPNPNQATGQAWNAFGGGTDPIYGPFAEVRPPAAEVGAGPFFVGIPAEQGTSSLQWELQIGLWNNQGMIVTGLYVGGVKVASAQEIGAYLVTLPQNGRADVVIEYVKGAFDSRLVLAGIVSPYTNQFYSRRLFCDGRTEWRNENGDVVPAPTLRSAQDTGPLNPGIVPCVRPGQHLNPSAANTDRPVMTGLGRWTGDQPAFQLATIFPGLQSARMTVLAGTVNVEAQAGGVMNLPVGTYEWSVGDTDDASLTRLNVDPLAGGDLIITYTYKGSAAG